MSNQIAAQETTFGKRGGCGPTAGKRGEIIRSPSTGRKRRVFRGQRWLVIAQLNESAKCDVLAFQTEALARQVSDRMYRSGFEVHYVEQAEVVQ